VSEVNPIILTAAEARDEVGRLRILVARMQQAREPSQDLEEMSTAARQAAREAATLRKELEEKTTRIQELEELNESLRQRAAASPPVPRMQLRHSAPAPRAPAPLASVEAQPEPASHEGDAGRPPLTTAFGEVLPLGEGYNKSYADAPIFDGTEREKYKAWKRAVMRKLKASACLYRTPAAGVAYVLSRLATLPKKMIDQADPDTPAEALEILDDAFLDHDEYGTALAALEKLKMAPGETVDIFLAKWRDLNIHLERSENSKPAIREFRSKLLVSLSNRLIGQEFATLAALARSARIVERDIADLNTFHPRQPNSRQSSAAPMTSPRPTPPTTAASGPSPAATPRAGTAPPSLPRPAGPKPPMSAERQALLASGKCFYCKEPGHRRAECPKAPPLRASVAPVAPVQPNELDPESLDRIAGAPLLEN
jgi:hypothetical protein